VFACGWAQAQNTWYGSAGDTNWSTPGNWSLNVAPVPGDTVVFDNTTPAPSAVVDNIVDGNFTIAKLTYSAQGTVGYHTTLINPGLSLNINGTGGNALYVGTGTQLSAADNVYWRVLGGGALTVTNSTGAIYVVQVGSAADHYATLDLSGLTNLSINVDQLLVGAFTFATGLNRPMGRMFLAENNYIQTAAGTTKPGILVAGYPGSDTNVRGTQQLFLGGNSIINSDVISVGGHKSTGQMLFRSGLTGGSAVIRGSAGGTDRVKLLTIGDPRARIVDMTGTGTSTSSTGTFNTTGNSLDLSVTSMMVARSQITGTGNATGTATFDLGTIDADNLYIGYHETGTTSAANATGTMNVNGTATVTVNNDLVMARKVGTGTPVGTLNVATNGTVNVKGSLVTSGGTSTLNFNNGGIVDLQPAGDPTPGNLTVSTLTGSGLITNAANVTNLVALTPGGAATAGTLTIRGNLTLNPNAAFNVNLADTTTVGGGVNDYINVTGDLNLNDNTLNVIPTGSSAAIGSYRLIDYTGTRSGVLSYINPTRYNIALDYPANQVNLAVSGSAGNLRWNSTSSTAWDLTTSNWFNTGTAAADKFLQLDSVLVDDSGAYTDLLLLGTVLFPNTVTVNSSTRDYLFGGSGRFSGAASLIKNGTSMLTVSNANDFTGPVQVNAGTLRVINNSALGAATSGTTVASGGTLDIFGSSLYNPGEPITIAGTGVGGVGAIINSGANQNNAIRSLTLSDDATIRQDNRFDVRGPGGSGSFSGVLDLGGFTLTKVGLAQFSLADVVATNAGSFDIQSGTFAVTRSLVDGPGVINLYTNTLQIENSTTGYCAKPIIVDGGVIRIVNNSFTMASPITNLSGGVTFDVSGAAGPTLTLTNVISGAGGVLKSNAGSVFFGALNPYSGPTVINAGSIELGPGSGLPNTPSITIAAGAALNVTNLAGGLTLASGQRLSGGTVLGDLTAGPGSTVAAGTSPGTLALGGNATFNNATINFELGANPTLGDPGNDLIIVTNNLSLSGVTTVNILPTATLDNLAPYTLFQYGNLSSGGSPNLSVTTPSRYSFNVLDPTTTVPYIQVQVVGSGTAASLLWQGGAAGNPNAWDFQTTSNWLNGASLDKFYSGDNLTFDDTSTTGSVTLIGTLSPAGVALNNSALAYTFGGSGAIASGYFTNWNGGSLLVNNSAPNTFNGLDLESGTVTLANTAANTISGPVVVKAGSLTFANAGINTFGTGIDLTGGTLTFNQPDNTTVFAAIGNANPGTAGALVKQGSNILTLSGNNATFDGPILVSAGILKAGNANALGTLSGATTVADGATLDINGTSIYNPGDEIIISGFGLSNTGAVINTGGTQQNAIRSLTLANNASIAAWGNRWDIRGPGGSGSLSGTLNLNGFTLTKLGPGQNSIVDAYVQNAGVIDVLGGTLGFTRCDVPAAGNMNLYTNTLVFDNYSLNSFSMPVTVNGGIIRLLGNGFTFNSLITNLAGGVTFDNSSGNTLTVAGDITGPGALAKTGANTVVLASANSTWSGSTTIGAATLQIGTAGYDGSLPDLPIINNGTLTFNSLNNFTNTTGISGTGGLSQTVGGIVTLTASNSYAGTTALSTTVTTSPGGSALRISNSDALGTTNGNTTINGNTGANASLELVGNNMVVPEAFSLSARQTEAVVVPHIRNVSGTNTLTGQITTTTGGNAYNIQSDSGLLTVAGNFVPPSTAGTRNLNLLGDGNGLWSGIVSNSADGLVPTVLNKYGLGTWTLSASNVYFGSTIIRTGTLALAASGSINSSPLIDIQTDGAFNVAAVSGGYVLGANQTLRGTGTVVGNVTASGTVTPGTSVGILTFANNLILAGTTIMELDRAGTPTADLIVAGALTCGGALVVNNIGAPVQVGDTFDLFNATSFGGGFTTITLPALGSGLGWDTSTVATDGIIKVIATIPTVPTNIGWSFSANNLTLSWPTDYTGWTLLVQTNNLAAGVSTNHADWGPVAGSTATNSVIIPIDAAKPTEFYRLAYPYP